MDGKNSPVLAQANPLGRPWQEGEGQKGNTPLPSTCYTPATLHSYFTLPRITDIKGEGAVVNFRSPLLPLQK